MHRTSLSRVHAISFLVFISLFIAGCEKKKDPIVGPDALPPSGGSISDDVRMAVLDSISSVFDRLPGVDPAADKQAALSYLKSRPEFEAAGMSPDGGNVWARFVDGRLFMYVNDRTPSLVPLGSRASVGQIETQISHASKTFDDFPGSSSARIMNSLGTVFGAAARSVDSIRRWCKLAGYTLSTPDVATIANLKTMKGDGIFYWATHGGYGVRNDAKNGDTYALWTADAVNAANEIKYLADLSSHFVQYMYATNDTLRGQKASSAMHYCVDLWFIASNMEFAPKSIVYFDACGSGGVDPSFSFSIVNGGLYIGWTQVVQDDDADRAARFFFDRTLGMNRNTPKLTPPQRPFFVEDVLSDMSKRGLDVSGPARLRHPFEPVLKTLRLLAPSIGLTFGKGDVSSTTYSIGGEFADDPGSNGAVLLNGKPLTILKWTANEITVQKPQTGGTLVVTVRNVKSNPVNLTEWHGIIDYTFTGRGTLKQHVVINLAFWADVHSFRPNILSPSMYMPYAGLYRPVEWMKSSSCTYECSGEFRNSLDEVVESWDGSSTIPMADFGSTGLGVTASALVDSAGTNSSMFLLVNGTYTQWTVEKGTSQQPLNLTGLNLDLTHSVPDFVLRGATKVQGNSTLTWNDMVAAYPPDPKAAQ